MRAGGMRCVAVLTVLLAGGCASTSGSRNGDLKVSDAWINTRAENEVQPLVSADERVTVSTQNGVVFLDGHVASVSRAEEFEKAISEIRGVREVKNNLVVKR